MPSAAVLFLFTFEINRYVFQFEKEIIRKHLPQSHKSRAVIKSDKFSYPLISESWAIASASIMAVAVSSFGTSVHKHCFETRIEHPLFLPVHTALYASF